MDLSGLCRYGDERNSWNVHLSVLSLFIYLSIYVFSSIHLSLVSLAVCGVDGDSLTEFVLLRKGFHLYAVKCVFRCSVELFIGTLSTVSCREALYTLFAGKSFRHVAFKIFAWTRSLSRVSYLAKHMHLRHTRCWLSAPLHSPLSVYLSSQEHGFYRHSFYF